MAIDANKIVRVVMEGSRIRDAKGIIPFFGVYLSMFSVGYYNRISFDFEKMMGAKLAEKSERLLIAAAQECGYTTFHGIRNSWEWEELVLPMLESDEDQITGFASIAVAFGWGDMKITELTPDEKLVVRVDDSYEAEGYLRRFGSADKGKCYMLRGVTAAFMGLVYGRDYPDGCFDFSAEEPSCRAKGDPFCEFIARRSPNR